MLRLDKVILTGHYWDKMVTNVSRIVVFISAIISIVLALNPPKLLAWLIWMGIGVMLCVFVTPLLSGLYWKKANRAGAVGSMVVGFTSAIVFGYIGKFVTKLPFHFSFIPFLLSIAVMVILSLLTKPNSEKVIEETETGLGF